MTTVQPRGSELIHVASACPGAGTVRGLAGAPALLEDGGGVRAARLTPWPPGLQRPVLSGLAGGPDCAHGPGPPCSCVTVQVSGMFLATCTL